MKAKLDTYAIAYVDGLAARVAELEAENRMLRSKMGGCAMSETYGTFAAAYVEAMRLRLSALEPENKHLAARVAELEARCRRLEEIGDMIVDEYMVEKAERDAWQQAKEAKP